MNTPVIFTINKNRIMNYTKVNLIYLFAFLYFIVTYTLALDWYNRGYFSVFDILFQTDPNINLTTFAHGSGRHAVTHAFIEFSAIPFRVLSLLAFKLNLIEDQVNFRNFLGLTVAPFTSAISIIVFYKTLCLMKLSKLQNIILVLIFSVSFNNILFSAIPETYAISCLFITVLLYCYIKEVYTKTWVDNYYWILFGFLLTGSAISNICIFFIVFLGSLKFNKKLDTFRALFIATLASIIILSSVILLYELVHYIADYPKGLDVAKSPDWIKRYVAGSFKDMLHNLVSLGSASFSNFFPSHFYIEPNLHCIKENLTCNKLSLQNGIISLPSILKFLVFLAFLSYAYFKSIKNEKWCKLSILCLMIIAYNFMLHTIIGDEMFLYLQHWITPLTLLLIPVLSQKKVYFFTFITLQILLNINFFLKVNDMVSMI